MAPIVPQMSTYHVTHCTVNKYFSCTFQATNKMQSCLDLKSWDRASKTAKNVLPSRATLIESQKYLYFSSLQACGLCCIVNTFSWKYTMCWEMHNLMVTQTTGSKLDSVLGYTLSWKDGSAWTGHHHLKPFLSLGDSMGVQKQKNRWFVAFVPDYSFIP